jgi:hypothetical protein
MSLIKLAAPRWFKELKTNKSLSNHILKSTQADKFHPKITKDHLSTRLKSEFLFKSKDVDELTVPLRLRKEYTIKHNDQFIRYKMDKNNLKLDNFYKNKKHLDKGRIEEIRFNNNIKVKHNDDGVKYFLDNKKLEPYSNNNEVIDTFRIMNPKNKTIIVSHLSISPDLKNINNFISKSSARDGHTINRIYTGIKESNDNSFKIFKKENRIKNAFLYDSEVPSNKLWYSPSLTLESDQPEIVILDIK